MFNTAFAFRLTRGEMDSDFFNPPLTERLKQILDKYPDGGQILKVLNTLDSQTKD